MSRGLPPVTLTGPVAMLGVSLPKGRAIPGRDAFSASMPFLFPLGYKPLRDFATRCGANSVYAAFVGSRGLQ